MRPFTFVLAVALAGCGATSMPAPDAAAPDAGGADASADLGPGPDAAPDAAPDAGPDAAPPDVFVGEDSATDSFVPDASPDAPADARCPPGSCCPTGPEVCNGIDDNCDGLVDNGIVCGDAGADGSG